MTCGSGCAAIGLRPTSIATSATARCSPDPEVNPPMPQTNHAQRALAPLPVFGNQSGELCPNCWSAVLREEGAHGRCDSCGWIGKCCE